MPPPVAALSQALRRFPLCRVGMPEGDWPKQLCKLGAGPPFPVRCEEDLRSGVLGDSKRCFQHFRSLTSAPVTLPIRFPAPVGGNLLLEALARAPVMGVSTLPGSQGQDGNELREEQKKERKEARRSLL